MKLKKTLNSLTCAAAALSSVMLVSCDDDSSSDSSSTPRIQFPSNLQSGDQIILSVPDIDPEEEPTLSTWNFSGLDSFEWEEAESMNTFRLFRTNRTAETFTLIDAGISRDAAELIFQERIDELLMDFNSPLRTIPFERAQDKQSLTSEDLIALGELINGDEVVRGKILVNFDPETEELLLITQYDVDFEVTSGIGSFVTGSYAGTFHAIQEGFIIRFRKPTADERNSLRLTSDHLIPWVTTAERDLSQAIEGNFTWTLSSLVPEDPDAASPADTTAATPADAAPTTTP